MPNLLYFCSPNDPNNVSDDEAAVTTLVDAADDEEAKVVEPTEAQNQQQPLKASPEMCFHCFDVLVEELKKTHSSNTSLLARNLRSFRHSSSISSGSGSATPTTTGVPMFVEKLPSESIECPLFITWEKKPGSNTSSSKHSDDYELRGCIGTLTPKPLVASIGDYALLSALRDKRFHPVTLAELPALRVAVSLLVEYETCAHCHDWVVGVHGIIIKFYAPGDSSTSSLLRTTAEHSATFLPEVAAQQGWDQHKTVQSLIRKAGYKESITPALLQTIRCTRYKSSKVKVSFEEYAQQNGHLVSILSDGSDTDSTGSQSNCHVM